jgi:hypothetical protein
VNMIRHQMSFLDPALLPSRQIVKHLAQMPLDLAEEKLLAVLRRKHDDRGRYRDCCQVEFLLFCVALA